MRIVIKIGTSTLTHGTGTRKRKNGYLPFSALP